MRPGSRASPRSGTGLRKGLTQATQTGNIFFISKTKTPHRRSLREATMSLLGKLRQASKRIDDIVAEEVDFPRITRQLDRTGGSDHVRSAEQGPASGVDQED